MRSRMRDRSNSANAPKIEKMSLPPAVVVSMPSVRDLKPTLLGEVLDELDEVLQGSAQAVQPPHHDGVARTKLVQEAVELGAAIK